MFISLACGLPNANEPVMDSKIKLIILIYEALQYITKTK